MDIAVIGAGVAGLCCASALLDRGVRVTVHEQSDQLGQLACSWLAGGMLAPWCEQEGAGEAVVGPGQSAITWWQSHVDGVCQNGSLVLSMQRDANELRRFARKTGQYRRLDREGVCQLEPDLENRFESGLYFADEAHLDPRAALKHLAKDIQARGGTIKFGECVEGEECGTARMDADRVIDCRGFAARDSLPTLRGVKGEMLILHNREVRFSRPIRLLHPRYPLYIVPRQDGNYMLGATMIESDDRQRISVRSMLELLSAGYALHPALAESEIVEIGVDVRPAFANNLPALMRKNNTLYLNGLFRHGFLLGPSMACQAAKVVLDDRLFMELEQCA